MITVAKIEKALQHVVSALSLVEKEHQAKADRLKVRINKLSMQHRDAYNEVQAAKAKREKLEELLSD